MQSITQPTNQKYLLSAYQVLDTENTGVNKMSLVEEMNVKGLIHK